jgi:hypothetical protein
MVRGEASHATRPTLFHLAHKLPNLRLSPLPYSGHSQDFHFIAMPFHTIFTIFLGKFTSLSRASEYYS